MKVIYQPTYEALSLAAANIVVESIAKASEGRIVLGLPTGSTPLGMYALLAQACAEGRLTFRNVITFNMDEYVAIPATHPESYHSFMYKNLFSLIDIPPENINILDGNAPDLEAECQRYEEKIAAAGGIDLMIGGVGRDGHVAFNEPNKTLHALTHVERLTDDTIRANARFFSDDTTQVPRQALTMGVATIFSARRVVILAAGKGKEEAIQRATAQEITTTWPVSLLQLHPDAYLIVEAPTHK